MVKGQLVLVFWQITPCSYQSETSGGARAPPKPALRGRSCCSEVQPQLGFEPHAPSPGTSQSQAIPPRHQVLFALEPSLSVVLIFTLSPALQKSLSFIRIEHTTSSSLTSLTQSEPLEQTGESCLSEVFTDSFGHQPSKVTKLHKN